MLTDTLAGVPDADAAPWFGSGLFGHLQIEFIDLVLNTGLQHINIFAADFNIDQRCQKGGLRLLRFNVSALHVSVSNCRLHVVVSLCPVEARWKTLKQLGKDNFVEIFFKYCTGAV